jgi:hypothetical protein
MRGSTTPSLKEDSHGRKDLREQVIGTGAEGAISFLKLPLATKEATFPSIKDYAQIAINSLQEVQRLKSSSSATCRKAKRNQP